MGRPNKRYETEDGPVFASRSVTVNAVIINFAKSERGYNSYVVLTKRSQFMSDSPGKWCVPSGYLDWDETIKEATIREVKEEIGLDLNELSRYFFYKLNFKINSEPVRKQNIEFSSLFYTYQLNLNDFNFKLDPLEVTEARLVHVKDLHMYDIAFDHADLIREAAEL
jgi:ADP-ribose pyrophosphatase YjhB (NUDIX family)